MPFTITYMQGDLHNASVKTANWALYNKPEIPPSQILSLKASGAGFNFIKLNFSNVPFINRDECTWRGSLAQFIYENL